MIIWADDDMFATLRDNPRTSILHWWARSSRLRWRVHSLAKTVSTLKEPESAGDPRKPIVLCLCRNGEHFIPAFLDHYRSRGFEEFVFLDNGSTDQTIPMLMEAPDVRAVQTDAPYKIYQRAMQRFLVENFGHDRWSLSVDVDEHFDYPGSGEVELSRLIDYLESNRFNAVVTHQLDMFGDVDLTLPARRIVPEDYPYYSLDHITARPLSEVMSKRVGTGISNFNDQKFFTGGVRVPVLGTRSWLSKVPLVFYRKPLVPMLETHFVGNAHLADVTCMYFHYKLVAGFAAQVKEATRRNHFQSMDAYSKAQDAFESDRLTTISVEGQKAFNSIRDLYGAFLDVPESYEAFTTEKHATS